MRPPPAAVLAPLLLLATCVGTALLVAGAAGGARAEDPPQERATMKEIQVGDTPGAFALNDQEGQAVRLGDGKGHGWFVLAFYPKASTGG